MTIVSPFPGKKGVCFRLGKEGTPGSWKTNLPKILGADAYWTYTWGLEGYEILQENGGEDLMWCPMSWGHPKTGTTQDLKEKIEAQNVPSLIDNKKVTIYFGFNEPDEEMQSNMKVDHAIAMWDALEALNVPLVSPSAAHPGGAWLEEFMEKAKRSNKRVDYLGVHWYGDCNFEVFKKQLTNWYTKYNLPIIITEFASADWSAREIGDNKHEPCKILDFMKKALPWLEETEWIVGYSWFSFAETFPPGCSSALYDADGNMTALGQYYKSVRSTKPEGNRMITAKEGKFNVTRGVAEMTPPPPIQEESQNNDAIVDVARSRQNDNDDTVEQQKANDDEEGTSLIDQVCGTVCGSRYVS